ncbi:MAG: sugar transferase [Intestinibacter bartlettii]|uniref:sugar transferase n=1 Tax=Intestinibacter bartlettii TaxID=261299 RepID=UPI00290BBE1F|nr:sugar transferase [Intestinibacter bartlettii]MDU6198513.1 sugar transferase [Intestinibacter bartlettii]
MYRNIKRILDILFSAILLVFGAIPLLIVALIIKIDSPGEALFKQERLGLDGKTFKIYKFRSMCVGAEKKGSGVYSGKNDTRVTRVGKIIRATSIDELPQLINIFKGEMSFIGPRPTLTYHPWKLEEYTDFQKRRFEVRPGVTGLAQINGRKDIPWDRRIEYDVDYVNNMSFGLDFKILLKTIVKVFTMSDNVNTFETAKNKNS